MVRSLTFMSGCEGEDHGVTGDEAKQVTSALVCICVVAP